MAVRGCARRSSRGAAGASRVRVSAESGYARWFGRTPNHVRRRQATRPNQIWVGDVSDVGAFDMPGNAGELVAEWGDRNDGTCTTWPAEFSSDLSCVGGEGSSRTPGAFLRSGYWGGDTGGVFTVRTTFDPAVAANTWGFRCVR